MINYLEKMLHLKPVLSEYPDVVQFPLYLKGGYVFQKLYITGIDCLLAKPKEQLNLAVLRKHYTKLVVLSGMECIFCFDTLSSYTRQKMIEEGIPFILDNKQIYLPFLGMALINEKKHVLPQIKQISFITQRLLLTAIYEHWTECHLTKAANALQVSKMSMTRCFNELESVGLSVIHKTGKTRCFVWNESTKALFTQAKPWLRSPIIREYRLENEPSENNLILSGISAICHYSMLADDRHKTYAVTKTMEKQVSLYPLVPEIEQPGCVLQVLAYQMAYQNSVAMDPISAVLSLTAEAKEDPRVDIAITKILEDVWNG